MTNSYVPGHDLILVESRCLTLGEIYCIKACIDDLIVYYVYWYLPTTFMAFSQVLQFILCPHTCT